MIEVIGISFENNKKIYYFTPNNIPLKKGDKVIVTTERGQQFGYVRTEIIKVDQDKLMSPLKEIEKVATSKDFGKHLKNLEDSKKAILDANKFIDELKLDMKILDASFTFDRSQLLFNFLSDDRVDFRELAKKLAAIYKTRIELRQIGVRDKAKEIGGIGQCGRALCCSQFLDDMQGVSINMAKNQLLALNPQKINGSCGRLMCCLSYENDCYNYYKKNLPQVGDKVSEGKVIYVDLFKKMYKVETPDGVVQEIFVKN